MRERDEGGVYVCMSICCAVIRLEVVVQLLFILLLNTVVIVRRKKLRCETKNPLMVNTSKEEEEEEEERERERVEKIRLNVCSGIDHALQKYHMQQITIHTIILYVCEIIILHTVH